MKNEDHKHLTKKCMSISKSISFYYVFKDLRKLI